MLCIAQSFYCNSKLFIANTMETMYLYFPLVLLIILYITTTRIVHKLRNLPPCPFPCIPFIGHIYLLKKPFHKTLSEISSRHGPILFFRFGSRPVLVVSSPSLAQECLTKNDAIFANRPLLINGKYFGYNYTSLAWCPYSDHWRNLRRIASLDLLSANSVHKLSQVRRDEIEALVRKLSAESFSSKSVNLQEALFELVFNVLTRMVFGKRYFGENFEGSEESRIFKDVLSETGKLTTDANVIYFLPFMRWFGRFRDTENKFVRVQEKRDRFMQDVIEECRKKMESCGNESSRENKVMIELLLDMQKAEPEYYTDELIRNLLLTLVQAGSDAGISTLQWALTRLLNKNRHVLGQAQDEIDSLVEKNRIIDESDLSQLHYLQCIIYETLRLHPPAPLLMPHESSSECTVADYFVPRGTMLLVNVWGIQHDPEFWDDPESFKPERFRDFEGNAELNDLKFKFFPFGRGRRACPGENLAMRVMALALGTLIQCFDWENESNIDMSEITGITTSKIQPLTARCRPRSYIVNLLT